MAADRVQRRLAAILAADVVGYSRLMDVDEEATLRTLKAYRQIIDGLVTSHRDRDFVAGSYSIADMAIYPWIHRLEREGNHLQGFPNLKRWHDAVSQRPAVARAYARARAINTVPTITEESKALLFGRDTGRRAA